MKPTEILKSEHRVIESVLGCLEKMARRALETGSLDGPSAQKALDFFRGFADRCHHGKEEDHLFPLMEARGFSRQAGPTGVMLHEHEQGRAAIQGMQTSLAGAAVGESPDLQKFVQNAVQYVNLLRNHIMKEDHCLFPMADQAFSAADQETLARAFDKVEHEDMPPEAHEKFLAVAQELCQRYAVAPVETAGCCGSCGHGHS